MIDKNVCDCLKQMFDQQEDFMKLLKEKRSFPDFPVDISKKESQKQIKQISYEVMGELWEALSELKNSKEHRITEFAEVDKEHLIEEFSDALHYFIEILILMGVSYQELFKSYMKKGDVNVNRINSGY